MSRHTFACIEGHTEGMPVRMVVSGGPELQGATMNDRRLFFVENYDWVRRALMLEPRGHSHMSGTIFYPPLSNNADFSLLFIETSGCLPMCGHATIGSISFALEAGLISPKQPGLVVVDVPAGQVTARYEMDGDRVASVRFTNVPSFLLHRDVEISHPQFGKLAVDIAYGGNFYPIVEVQENYPGCEHFSPEQLLEWGRDMQRLVNDAIDVVHPDNAQIRGVKHCMWTGRPTVPESDGRAVVIAGDSLIDRSPCGTGSSARVAQRFARGLLDQGQPFKHESLIGSRFIGRAEEPTKLKSGLDAVFPSIEGRAWITGRGEHYVDDAQPYAYGFSLQEFAK
ncbi:4-hydroxyproline epimerase [Paraburkholderia rhynchosiae]|uniref:4-hydroxyproline 2-epimerase 2 n=1 Tax=Paraburkholderia rhynchosiae TaxID=487049 RepID=A0A2N7VMY6_9BURK|nr:4-hydroxyproline epimerase [Paraburkholderia rhynchosiae]PMS18477.1 hydroxyproline-2-epimerase [Paraburkholderia rhynchosiae]CAB3743689.1 4-hydroxyproline 2-epimerase 2 [Paraburkholderia rhynchosiae]